MNPEIPDDHEVARVAEGEETQNVVVERPVREAKFTPYDVLQDEAYDAGEPGVYLNLKGVGKPLKRGRPKKVDILAVFKSNKLKDSEYLAKNKNSWVATMSEIAARKEIEAEDNTEAPKKKRKTRTVKGNSKAVGVFEQEAAILSDPANPDNTEASSGDNEPPFLPEVDEQEVPTLPPKMKRKTRAFKGKSKFVEVVIREAATLPSNPSIPQPTSSEDEQPCISEVDEQEVPTLPPKMKRKTRAFKGKSKFVEVVIREAATLPSNPSTPQSTSSKDEQPCIPEVGEQETPLHTHSSASEQPATISDHIPVEEKPLATSRNIEADATVKAVSPGHLLSALKGGPSNIPYISPYASFSQPQAETPEVTDVPIPAVYPEPQNKKRAASQTGSSNPDGRQRPRNVPYISPYASSSQPQAETPEVTDVPIPAVDPEPQNKKRAASQISSDSPDGQQRPTNAPYISPYASSSQPQVETPEVTDVPIPAVDPEPQNKKRAASQISSDDSDGESEEVASKKQKTASTRKVPKAKAKSRAALAAEAEEKLKLAIESAAAISVPNEAARFACTYEGQVGNLIVSPDQTVSEFYAVSQHPPQLPLLTIKTSQIPRNPITSMPGSKPMELRVKTKTDDSPEVAHCFVFIDNAQGMEAAGNMRAKIIAANIAFKFRSGRHYAPPVDTELEIVKPFTCELCGARFKNRNGLEYHVTKSFTTCNPNVDPEKVKAKNPPKVKKPYVRQANRGGTAEGQERISKRTGKPFRKYVGRGSEAPSTSDHRPVSSDSAERMVESRGENGAVDKAPEVEAGQEKQSESDNSDESDDSILQWAQQNAFEFNGPTGRATNANKKEPKRRQGFRYVALHREALTVQEIANEYTPTGNTPSSEDAEEPRLETGTEDVEYIVKSVYPARTPNAEDYKKFLLELIAKNNNMFSEDRSLWMASINIWLQKLKSYAHGDQGFVFDTEEVEAPQYKVCRLTLDNLVGECVLEKHEFTFMDKKSREARRHFFVTPGTDLASPRIEMLKELIVEAHPGYYLPAQFAPARRILNKLQCCASLAFARELEELRSESESESNEETEEGIEEDTEDQIEEGGIHPDLALDSSEDEEFREQNQNNKAIDSQSEESEDSDNESNPQNRTQGRKSQPSRRSLRSNSGAPFNRTRNQAHKERISNGLRVYWNKVRQDGKKVHYKTGEELVHYKTGKPMKLKGTTTDFQQEKNRRETTSWATQFSHTPAFLPDPETGAWGHMIEPVRVARALPQKNPHLRPRLPEAITYMQSENGAWDVRPFGHGVKPIFARPTRRRDGNPNWENYLKNVQQSFRPIIVPEKYKDYVPSLLPSKNRQTKATKDSRVGATKRKRGGQPGPRNSRRRKTESQDLEEDENSVEIPKATGKPVRKYQRKQGEKRKREVVLSELGDSDGSEDDEFTPPAQEVSDEEERPTTASGRPRRKRARYGSFDFADEDEYDFTWQATPPRNAGLNEVLNEVDIVNFFEPKKLGDGGPRNPGLETLPPSFGLKRRREEYAEESQYEDQYDAIQFQGSFFATAYTKCVQTEDYKIRWDNQTAFTLENLPYSELVVDDDGEIDLTVFNKLTEAREVEPPRKRRRRFQQQEKLKQQPREVQKLDHHRYQTHLLTDFEGIYKNLEAAMSKKVQLAAPNAATKRRRRTLGGFSAPEQHRFTITVIIIQTLTGGLDLVIDWVLIATLFQKQAMGFLTKTWNGIYADQSASIERFRGEFQEIFPEAYEKRAVDPINYDKLLDYDWNKLVGWVYKNVETHLANKPINIPATKNELVNGYIVKDMSIDHHSRDTVFGHGVANYKRVAAACFEQISVPLTKPSNEELIEEDPDDLTIAKSWVKVVAMTPPKAWDQAIATAKLVSFGHRLTTEAVDELLKAKVIINRTKGRSIPGRTYEASDAFSAPFRQKIREDRFVEAINFKRWLDSEFRSGKEKVQVDYMANEGYIMVATSLIAAGRLTLKPVGVPMNKFGLTDGGYETRNIPKSRLRFEMDMYPTDKYLYDSQIDLTENTFNIDPPRGENLDLIPCWFGISEALNLVVWRKVLVAVGQIMALRAGVNIKELTRIFRPSLEEWEVRMLVQWGEQWGIFKRFREGMEGWMVGEWWWGVVGRWCAGEEWMNQGVVPIRKPGERGLGVIMEEDEDEEEEL